jgi:hypothetical protein
LTHSKHHHFAITAKVDVRARWRFRFIDVSKLLSGLYYRENETARSLPRTERLEQSDSARVKYDEHQELDVSEDTYRARDYQPPFDELPWKDEPANDA